MNFSPEYSNSADRKQYTIADVHKAITDNEIMDGLVLECSGDLQLVVRIGRNITGTIKFSELEYRIDGKDSKEVAAMSKVGKHVKFIPLYVEEDGDNYIVQCSRKAAQKKCYDEYISKLVPGDIIDAKIVKTESYGAFCDIGCGIVALLPTKLISVTHVVDPERFLAASNKLKVVVNEIQEDGKIQLTHRELLGTWEDEVQKIQAGSTQIGAVLSVEDYGVFVRLTQNLSGLAQPPEGIDVKPGDLVSVHINSIDSSKLKIRLSIMGKIEGYEEVSSFDYYMTDGRIDEWIYSDNKKKEIKNNFVEKRNSLKK